MNFMPELWQKIERTQAADVLVPPHRQGLCDASGGAFPGAGSDQFCSLRGHSSLSIVHNSYVEALAAHSDALDARNVSDSVEYVQDLIHTDSVEDNAAEI